MQGYAELGQAEIQRKHEEQIAFHEMRFGKLGELQTEKQKSALAEALGKEKKKPAKKAAASN